MAIFEMSEGAVFTYRGSWCAERLYTTWESVNDTLMEQLADDGDGFYAYVDTLEEAHRIFVEQLRRRGTNVTALTSATHASLAIPGILLEYGTQSVAETVWFGRVSEV